MKKRSIVIGQHSTSAGSFGLRAVLGGVMLVGLVVLPSAGPWAKQSIGSIPGSAATFSWALSSTLSPASAADPDLCVLLPTGPDLVVVPDADKGRTIGCAVENRANNRQWSHISVYKYASVDAAHDFVLAQFNARSGKNQGPVWVPATAYGDAGYAYDIPAAGCPICYFGLSPSLIFARNCYLVTGDAGMDPAPGRETEWLDPGAVRRLAMSLDKQLQQTPCDGNVGQATPTPVPPAEDNTWRVTVGKIENARWFGANPPTLTRKDDSVIELKEGMLLAEGMAEGIGTISTGAFRVHLTWSEGTSGTLWQVTLGPDSQVSVGTRMPPEGPPSKLTRFVEVTHGVAGFVLPHMEEGSSAPFQASTHTLVAATSGATFRLTYDEKTQKSSLQLQEGDLQVTPSTRTLPPFQLHAGQQLHVDTRTASPITPYVPLPGEPGTVFRETGQAVNGIFLDYWFQHGGLAQQGYPISGEMREQSDLNGQTYTVQYFERAVFEYHPEFSPPNDVQLSQLGTFQYKRAYPDGAPNQRLDQTDGKFFPETGHCVGGKFGQYGQEHGGLAQHGLPLSDEFVEVSATNGKPYLVQYFERAVFEEHPESAPPNDLLLSLLGVSFYESKHTGGGLHAR